jgi:hypothetical protein
MSNNIDAVIAALRVALNEAERSQEHWWKVRAANRWINQLPMAWIGRWWHLRLRAQVSWEGLIPRAEFIGHVRATLAYLEANREEIRSMRLWSWPLSRRAKTLHSGPVDAEFKVIAEADGNRSLSKPRLTKH